MDFKKIRRKNFFNSQNFGFFLPLSVFIFLDEESQTQHGVEMVVVQSQCLPVAPLSLPPLPQLQVSCAKVEQSVRVLWVIVQSLLEGGLGVTSTIQFQQHVAFVEMCLNEIGFHGECCLIEIVGLLQSERVGFDEVGQVVVDVDVAGGHSECLPSWHELYCSLIRLEEREGVI